MEKQEKELWLLSPFPPATLGLAAQTEQASRLILQSWFTMGAVKGLCNEHMTSELSRAHRIRRVLG